MNLLTKNFFSSKIHIRKNKQRGFIMKKTLLLTIAGCFLFPTMSFAAPRGECRYHPIQQVVRMARSEQDIEKEIAKKTNFNIHFPCGGSVLQLAILRGNPQVLQVLLEKANLNPNEMISNDEFPIKGAPKELPISFFAAYYAPRADILTLFVDYAGDDIYKKDANNQNILWYLEQNPVLNNTEISDQIIDNLVLIDSEKQNERERLQKEEETRKLEQLQQSQTRQRAISSRQSAPKSSNSTNADSQNTESNMNQPAPKEIQRDRTKNLIEQEPEKAFKPEEESFDLQGSDF